MLRGAESVVMGSFFKKGTLFVESNGLPNGSIAQLQVQLEVGWALESWRLGAGLTCVGWHVAGKPDRSAGPPQPPPTATNYEATYNGAWVGRTGGLSRSRFARDTSLACRQPDAEAAELEFSSPGVGCTYDGMLGGSLVYRSTEPPDPPPLNCYFVDFLVIYKY